MFHNTLLLIHLYGTIFYQRWFSVWISGCISGSLPICSKLVVFFACYPAETLVFQGVSGFINGFNLKNKIDIENGSCSRWESVSAKTFRETDVSYAFRLNNADKAIVAAIKIPKDLLNNFPYTICFLFYNGGRPYFMYVEAKTENSYYYISTPADRQSRKRIDELDTNMCRAIDCDKEIIIESSIPLEYIDTPLKKGLICYNVTVQKYRN